MRCGRSISTGAKACCFNTFCGVSEGLTFFNLESRGEHQIRDLGLLAGVESVGDGGRRSVVNCGREHEQERRQDAVRLRSGQAGGTKSERAKLRVVE
jgi:hypothetical protein